MTKPPSSLPEEQARAYRKRVGWNFLLSPGCKPLLVALLLLSSGARAEPGTASPDSRAYYRIHARLDARLRTLEAQFSLTFTPTSPIERLTWLVYPPLLDSAKNADELTFNHLYPGGFSPAGLEFDVHQAGTPLRQEPIEPQGSGPVAPRVCTRLAHPALAGEPLQLEGRFTLHIPVRLGAFGLAEGQLTLLGGWFPMLLAPASAAAPELALPEIYLELLLEHPVGEVARLDGDTGLVELAAMQNGEGASSGFPSVRTRLSSSRRLPLLTVGRSRPYPLALSVSSAKAPTRLEALLLDWRGTAPERRRLGLMLERMLKVWVEANLPVPTDLPPLVRAPLRRALTEPLEHGILLSDRALRAFPLVRRLHEYGVVQAIYRAWLLQIRSGLEPAWHADWIADTLAWTLTERYRQHLFLGSVRVLDLMRTLSFAPQIDQMLVAPRFAFSSELLDAPYRMDPLRESVRSQVEPHPGGQVMWMKLEDRFGAEAVSRAARAALGSPPVSFLHALSQEAGVRREDLETWLQGWRRPYPRVDYQLTGVSSTRTREGWRTTVDVQEVPLEEPPPEEPVEVAATGRQVREVLRWNGRGQARLELHTHGPVRRVELDPARRLLEVDAGGVLLRDNNRWPPPVKLLFALTPGTVDFNTLQVTGGLGFYLTRPHDRRWLGALELYSSSQVLLGGTSSLSYYFGPFRDAQYRSHRLGLSLSLDHRADFDWWAGPSDRALQTAGARISYRFDNRLLLLDGVRGALVYVGVEAGMARERAQESPYLEGNFALVKPVELRVHHAVVGRIQLDAALGVPEGEAGLGAGLYALGGPSALRALAPDKAVGNLRWLTSLEYRWTVLRHLDLNLGLARLRKLQWAFFLDAGAVGAAPTELVEPILGWGSGLRVFSDIFGVRQGLLGLDLAWALPTNGDLFPRVLLRAGQAF